MVGEDWVFSIGFLKRRCEHVCVITYVMLVKGHSREWNRKKHDRSRLPDKIEHIGKLECETMDIWAIHLKLFASPRCHHVSRIFICYIWQTSDSKAEAQGGKWVDAPQTRSVPWPCTGERHLLWLCAQSNGLWEKPGSHVHGTQSSTGGAANNTSVSRQELFFKKQ